MRSVRALSNERTKTYRPEASPVSSWQRSMASSTPEAEPSSNPTVVSSVAQRVPKDANVRDTLTSIQPTRSTCGGGGGGGGGGAAVASPSLRLSNPT